MEKKIYEEIKEIKILNLAQAQLMRDILLEIRRITNGKS